MRITSPRNPVVHAMRSLERAAVRREEGVYLAEGVRLVSEALATGQAASAVLYDPSHLARSEAGERLRERLPHWADRAYEVDSRVLRAAARTESPAGVLAALRFPNPPPLSSHAGSRFGVVLDRLSDPGNAGTILRTADAAGVDYVVTSEGSVDLFSPKVVRAGMGAHFRLDLYPHVGWEDLARTLPSKSWVAAVAADGCSIFDFQWPHQGVLLVGSEAEGLSREAEELVTHRVRIPMRQGVESLNASVAASITIYWALGPSLPMGK